MYMNTTRRIHPTCRSDYGCTRAVGGTFLFLGSLVMTCLADIDQTGPGANGLDLAIKSGGQSIFYCRILRNVESNRSTQRTD